MIKTCILVIHQFFTYSTMCWLCSCIGNSIVKGSTDEVRWQAGVTPEHPQLHAPASACIQQQVFTCMFYRHDVLNVPQARGVHACIHGNLSRHYIMRHMSITCAFIMATFTLAPCVHACAFLCNGFNAKRLTALLCLSLMLARALHATAQPLKPQQSRGSRQQAVHAQGS